ncbi:MAG: AbrB/MazE/SpoVT family DNA-binding domain-containing protein [Gemmiger sp.]
MKSTGIIRNIDRLGRFVLPKELRDSFAITEDTPLEIFTEGDTILLRKYRPAGCCDLCGEITQDTLVYRGKRICGACRRALSEM